MARLSTGAIENRLRDMKSLTVRAANIGTDSANVLFEVFHARRAADGPSTQELYVQRLVTVIPDQVQNFDNIFADLDAVTVRVTTSGAGQDSIAVSVAALDAARRAIHGFVSSNPERLDPPQQQGGE